MRNSEVKRPVKSIGEKFEFLNQVLSNPRHRTKQMSSFLTPIRAAVTCKIAQYYNLDKKYSYVSQRRLSQEIDCSQATIGNNLVWLEKEGYIKRVDDRKANKVGRYVLLIKDEQSLKSDQADQSLDTNHADQSLENNQTDQSHRTDPKRNNGTKVKLKENGPSRCGSRRRAAAPSRGPVDVNKAMEYLRR